MNKLNIFFLILMVSMFSANVHADNIQNKNLKMFSEQIPNDEITMGDSLITLKDNLVQENTSPIISPSKKSGSLNLKEVFSASPIIYSTLMIMSIVSVVILLYTLIAFKQKDLMSKSTVEDIKEYLLKEQFDEALSYCENKKNLLATMIASGIYTRSHGAQFMIETIKSEGKRATESFWHRISILNDIVIIAPMLGLLGTVIGMFYAFYDINRSIDSLSALFDGLGVAVGTTVGGLVVAIIAMIFYSILKFRMVKSLSLVENEAVSLGNLIRTKE